MRILYLIFYFNFQYTLRLFYKNLVVLNKPARFERTVYVSNHAASFMDPLVIAAFNKSVLYFMTRSDVFTSFTRPIFWMAHMLPIYRQRDGVNTKEKNIEAFKKCTEAILKKRSLLIFGEGFTDDVFIRRLKPIKKGAARIAFTTLEACDWKEDIYIAAVGCNYSNPNKYGSDLLISTSEKIHLNVYKEQYLENPGKVINEITAKVEQLLKNQLTHLNEEERAGLHEQIMTIQRKGMSDAAQNNKESLQSRWEYSRKLAAYLNNSDTDVKDIEFESNEYFKKLKEHEISDQEFFESQNVRVPFYMYLLHILLLPFVLLGFVHCGILYLLIKRFVEKKFRRAVFWGSTKVIMMIFIAGILNLGVFFILPCCIGWPLSIVYFLLIPLFGDIFHSSLTFWKKSMRMRSIRNRDLGELSTERNNLNLKILNFVEAIGN